MPFDASRLMSDIETLADYYATKLGPELSSASEQAWALLQQTDQETLRQAAHQHTQRVLAFPEENPAVGYPLPPAPQAYRILASDGSSVEPDPHFLARYAILHAAVAGMAYAPPAYWANQRVRFLYEESDLQIVPPNSEEPVSVEGPVIDTLRAHEELQVLWDGVNALSPDEYGRPLLALTDAILLWTHRGSGPGHEILRDDYLTRSVELINSFQQARVPLVGFISSPHHREVVHTLMAQSCRAARQLACTDCPDLAAPCRALQGLQDRHIFAFLPEGARSALFRPIFRGDTRWRLPEAACDHDPRLAFCYLNTGPEIARLEIPLWVLEEGALDLVHGIVVDQCRPLRAEVPGYPVVLTMAHQEAVLTTRDRQAVQWLVEEALARRRVYSAPSAKARMKDR